MTKQTIRRRPEDNEYLPLEFHGQLSGQLDYLEEKYGEDAVRRYLWQFASHFYAPLTQTLKERGLVALKERFETIYALEGGTISICFSEDEMVVEVEACPAVTFMRAHGQHVARLWYETSKTTYAAICDGTPFASEMVRYDPQTGQSTHRFYRRAA
jgi:hypothetical protein